MTGLGGSVEGNFLNNGTATANNLSVLGPFANPGSLTFTSGSLYRSAATTNDGTITLRGGGLSLSNGLTNKGVLNGYGLPLRFSIENYGLIAADVSGQTLTIGTDGTSTPTINNYGTIRIINGGVLSLIGAAINGGTITANNGTVATSFTTINGSTLNGNSGDLFTVSNSTFNQVTNNAPVQASGLNIQGGTLVNNNTITAVGFSSAYGSALYFSGATNLTGSGEIALQSASITGSTVTSNQLIHGSGLIRNSINSYGGIAADVSGQTLTIGTDGTSTPTINNYGSIRIINGGVLSLIGAAINGGTITANNGTVTTSFTTINGSTLNGSTGDLFTVSNSTFNQVTNNAPVDVTGLNIQGGTLVNNNTITARGFSSAYGSALYFSGATNLTGSGEIALQSASITGSTVTSNQLIHGSGLIRNSINSYGGIAANVSGQTLTIGTDGTSTPTINNYGTIRIINGGVLSLIGAAINGGTITANNGTVATSFTTINGSTLNGNSGDLFTVSNSTFNQVTNNAPVDATGLNIQGGTLVNNNTITARGFSSAYGSALYFSSATNLTGTGEIVFANANSTGGRITQEFGHTLRGNGSIGNPVVNGGVLEPGLGIGTLSVNNTVSLLDSSILRFELGGLAQGVTYDYLAIGGSMQLDGILSLDVSYDLKLQLAESDVFTIITSNDLSGSFDNGRNGDRITTGDGLASFIINYGPTSPFAKNNVVLSQGQIVPEPSSLILAAVGLGGYFSIRRRKNTA